MDRGTWQATVHGVTESQTQFSSHTIQMRVTHSSHKHKAAADSTTSKCLSVSGSGHIAHSSTLTSMPLSTSSPGTSPPAQHFPPLILELFASN